MYYYIGEIRAFTVTLKLRSIHRFAELAKKTEIFAVNTLIEKAIENYSEFVGV